MAYASPNWWTCAGIKWSSHRHAARPQGQAGHPKHPSDPRGRTAGAAAASARAGAQVTLRIHLGTGSTVQHRWLRPHGRTGGQGGQASLQGAPAHAQARLRVCLPTRGTTRGPCRPISVTAIFSTRCVIPNYRRRGLRISGEAKFIIVSKTLTLSPGGEEEFDGSAKQKLRRKAGADYLQPLTSCSRALEFEMKVKIDQRQLLAHLSL